MATRKVCSVTFKMPPGFTLADIKQAIDEELSSEAITVFQELSTNYFLIELADQGSAEELINNGFDVEGVHIACSPPHRAYTNISVMGLKAYIKDEDITAKLSQYGEIKGNVIRLKYKADHPLHGLENGNRLVRMILTKPSIPYSLQIVSEWCHIIRSNQQRICSNCDGIDHTRKQCPYIQCHSCDGFGHVAQHCPQQRQQQQEIDEQNATSDQVDLPDMDTPPSPSNSVHQTPSPLPETEMETTDLDQNPITSSADKQLKSTTSHTDLQPHASNISSDPAPPPASTPPAIPTSPPPQAETLMEDSLPNSTGQKRQHQTDSDTDTPNTFCQPKSTFKPNTAVTRRTWKSTDDSTPQSKNNHVFNGHFSFNALSVYFNFQFN